MTQKKSYTYADSGVSIDAGNAFVKAIGPLVKRTARKGANAELGGFGAFFDLEAAGYQNPLLVAATDGVGTKLRLAIDYNRHDGIGIDAVAMCVNDLIVQGAEPLFFLDYFATGKLKADVAAEVIAGIATGCERAHCALIGGETAEMPGMYADGDYDLAGFAVGAVERDQAVTGAKVTDGDFILGLASSGFHSNGYSLIRQIIQDEKTNLQAPLPQDSSRTLLDVLLKPTRIYVKSLLPQIRANRIKSLSHITGGGLLENVPRTLPQGARARITAGGLLDSVLNTLPASARAHIDADSWDLPPAFRWLQQVGGISSKEMARTFNCGIGMVAIVAPDDVTDVILGLTKAGETVHVIGKIESGKLGCDVEGHAGTWGVSEDWLITHDG